MAAEQSAISSLVYCFILAYSFLKKLKTLKAFRIPNIAGPMTESQFVTIDIGAAILTESGRLSK